MLPKLCLYFNKSDKFRLFSLDQIYETCDTSARSLRMAKGLVDKECPQDPNIRYRTNNINDFYSNLLLIERISIALRNCVKNILIILH